MHEIKCPKCGTVFTIDENSYADILSQVRGEAFKAELAEQVHLLEKQQADQTALLEKSHQQELKNATAKSDSEIALLKQQLKSAQSENATKAELTKQEFASRLQSALAEKDQAITELKSALQSAKTSQKLAVAEATHQLERENDSLKKDLETAKTESQSKALILKQSYEQQLKDRDEMIDRLKDLKAKLSTKMVGETLEQHCQTEFNSIRATAFPRAEFGKDNAVSASGSKGDFIFRDFAEDGTEIVSIMFEMKNENDTTATKHKNEHFFKELDKDRNEKNCEYAVLVSLLESDNELYNQGIVDVSYEYPKMYVIRPQFFLPLISIIANTAKNALAYKSELATVKNQNIDITNFEDSLNQFKDSFSRNSELATKNFTKAIDEIDKTIKSLEKTKHFLQNTAKNFTAANNKLDKLTIKRLTKGNETMTKLFSEQK